MQGTARRSERPSSTPAVRGEERWSAWMAQAQSGDAEVYRKLLEELRDASLRYLNSRFGASAWSEDCCQEILVAVHRARHTYDPARSFEAWFFAIVRHKAVDTLRRRSVRPSNDAMDPDTLASSPGAMSDEDRLDTQRALGWLDEDSREALLLVKFEGYTVADAAGKIGISSSAMRSRVHRATKLVRARLRKEAAS